MIKNNSYCFPVVLFVFKRPENVLRLLQIIRKSGQKNIYIFADHSKSEEDEEATLKVKAVLEKFQLAYPEITLKITYATRNLGLRTNIIKGLDTVFKSEKAAIFLEDDCLPHSDFFPYMAKMLQRYRDDHRILSVNGTSVGFKSPYSYDFTKYPLCWGWGTWRRAWNLYDKNLEDFDQLVINSTIHSPIMRWYWSNTLYLVRHQQIDTWDYQWTYTHFKYQGLAISPSANLIQNIGFDNVATNTKIKSVVSSLPTDSLKLPLIHPPVVKENLNISSTIETKFYMQIVPILGIFKSYLKWGFNQK